MVSKKNNKEDKGRGFVIASWILVAFSILIGIFLILDIAFDLVILIFPFSLLLLPLPVVSLFVAIVNCVNKRKLKDEKDIRESFMILGVNGLAIVLIVIGRFFIEHKVIGIPFLGGN